MGSRRNYPLAGSEEHLNWALEVDGDRLAAIMDEVLPPQPNRLPLYLRGRNMEAGADPGADPNNPLPPQDVPPLQLPQQPEEANGVAEVESLSSDDTNSNTTHTSGYSTGTSSARSDENAQDAPNEEEAPLENA